MINWNRKLAVPGVKLVLLTHTPAGTVERVIDVREMRQILKTRGLDVTTKEAVDWGTPYPAEANHLTLICTLQQRLADLRHRLRARRG